MRVCMHAYMSARKHVWREFTYHFTQVLMNLERQIQYRLKYLEMYVPDDDVDDDEKSKNFRRLCMSLPRIQHLKRLQLGSVLSVGTAAPDPITPSEHEILMIMQGLEVCSSSSSFSSLFFLDLCVFSPISDNRLT